MVGGQALGRRQVMRRDGVFWRGWIVANGIGWAIGLPLFGLLMIIVGVAQWLLLRRHLPQSGYWLVATTGGWLAAYLLLGSWAVTDPLGYPPGANLLLFGLAGALVGTAQWLALRRSSYQSWWWIAASAIGGAFCLPAYQLVWEGAIAIMGPHELVALTGLGRATPASWAVWVLQGAICGLVYAVPTGLVLRGVVPRIR